jgi:TANK-binding kinase 1
VKVFSQAGHMRPHDVQMREFEVMTKLKHKNIVPMLAIEDEVSFPWLKFINFYKFLD